MGPGDDALSDAPPAVQLDTALQMISAAQDRFRGAQSALREWDWSRAGEQLKALEATLAELRQELERQR